MVTDVVLILLMLGIVGGAVAYIIREKRRGVKCIGCPYAKECAKRGRCSKDK